MIKPTLSFAVIHHAFPRMAQALDHELSGQPNTKARPNTLNQPRNRAAILALGLEMLDIPYRILSRPYRPDMSTLVQDFMTMEVAGMEFFLDGSLGGPRQLAELFSRKSWAMVSAVSKAVPITQAANWPTPRDVMNAGALMAQCATEFNAAALDLGTPATGVALPTPRL